MIKIVEIGIPIFHAKETLPAALDSLVAQTKKNFIVCLSIDGDNEDYTDIINTYKARGLKIRVINGKFNGGAGEARQRVIDSTMCDYIMFLDADDMLMPRAVELLYGKAKPGGYDILRGSFIREQANTDDMLMASTDNIITWFHAKIYRVQFLREKNIRFLPLRTDEDSYFNAVAWNSTDKKGLIDEVLYIWRHNKNSITRVQNTKEYFSENYINYIYGQCEALKKIFELNKTINDLLVTNTLINIYYYYMKARFYKLDETCMDKCLSSLAEEKWFQAWIGTGENWIDIINTVKPGTIYDDSYVIFYDETFNKWAARIFKANVA